MKSNILIIVTVTFFALVTVAFREGQNHQGLEKLRNQVAEMNNKEASSLVMTNPPIGTGSTTDWPTFKDQSYRFTLQYPSNWIVNDRRNNPIIPKRLVGVSQDIFPLLLTTSSNQAISPGWKQISLAGGEKAYYSFEDGFDHYYMINGANMLIWTIPARSHDGQITNQELIEATQIINSYRRLSII